MENSNFVKIIILVLAGLTIWNTFRIETVIEDGGLVPQASSADNLFTTEGLTNASLEEQVAFLTEQIALMQKEVESQQSAIDRLSRQPKSSTSSTGSGRSSASSSRGAAPKIDAKVRVDNRYVEGRTHLPSGKNGITGTVVVEVKMNQLGMVGTATIIEGTTITDEDVRHSCKEAALKTDFSFNPEAPTTTVGTITYTFSN